MHLYLLETSVTMDVNKLPFEYLLVIALSILLLLVIVLANGISLKFGEKEINIGGILRTLAKKDKDTLLKENLKKFSDDVDHDVTADLYDLVGILEDSLEPPLVLGAHCYFTYEQFKSIVENELYKRIRRNNLWMKLTETSRDKYITTILNDIGKRYKLLQEKANHVRCGDTYAEFADIKEAVRGVLAKFFDGAVEILVNGMERKIEKYELAKQEFKTREARKFCCDDCIAKNQNRINKLHAKTVTI